MSEKTVSEAFISLAAARAEVALLPASDDIDRRIDHILGTAEGAFWGARSSSIDDAILKLNEVARCCENCRPDVANIIDDLRRLQTTPRRRSDPS